MNKFMIFPVMLVFASSAVAATTPFRDLKRTSPVVTNEDDVVALNCLTNAAALARWAVKDDWDVAAAMTLSSSRSLVSTVTNKDGRVMSRYDVAVSSVNGYRIYADGLDIYTGFTRGDVVFSVPSNTIGAVVVSNLFVTATTAGVCRIVGTTPDGSARSLGLCFGNYSFATTSSVYVADTRALNRQANELAAAALRTRDGSSATQSVGWCGQVVKSVDFVGPSCFLGTNAAAIRGSVERWGYTSTPIGSHTLVAAAHYGASWSNVTLRLVSSNYATTNVVSVTNVTTLVAWMTRRGGFTDTELSLAKDVLMVDVSGTIPEYNILGMVNASTGTFYVAGLPLFSSTVHGSFTVEVAGAAPGVATPGVIGSCGWTLASAVDPSGLEDGAFVRSDVLPYLGPLSYWHKVHGGDSGCALCLLTSAGPVLYSHWWQAASTSGSATSGCGPCYPMLFNVLKAYVSAKGDSVKEVTL